MLKGLTQTTFIFFLLFASISAEDRDIRLETPPSYNESTVEHLIEAIEDYFNENNWEYQLTITEDDQDLLTEENSGVVYESEYSIVESVVKAPEIVIQSIYGPVVDGPQFGTNNLQPPTSDNIGIIVGGRWNN